MPAARLLSTPGIFQEDKRVAVPKGKTSALLYYLAYQGDWVSRDDILFLFWPDTEEQKARRNLRQLLSVIRALPFTDNLETTAQHVRWVIPNDALVFKEALAEKGWTEATACYHGPLLYGFRSHKLPEFESWLELERASLQTQYRNAVFYLSEQLEREGRYAQAADTLDTLYRLEPLNEEILQHYLKLLALANKRSTALSIYEQFVKTLALELDAEPDATTQNLVVKLHSGEWGTQASDLSDRLERPTAVQSKLPTPPTQFVGRETELDQLMGLLRDPACRLLSLVAAGGMGKTRLAIELAGRLESNFADGVCFIPFEAISSPELMVAAIAESLSFTFLGQQDPKEQLFNYLENKQTLLVADNLEHLVDGAKLLSELLEHAPGIKILATSRRTLNLHAEWLYDVTGMSVTQTPGQDNDAVQLFMQSAKKATGTFQLDEQNYDAVTSICERVGGMPLAIELAASWLRVLTPQDIAAELAKGLESLSGNIQDMPERHQSVQSIFEHSWKRLSLTEQNALKNLAVFHGGFDRASAEAITQTSLPLLLSFSNKSFLRRDDTGRFTQHPLVWQFAREKAEGEHDFDAIKERHAVYFAAFLKAREKDHERLHAKRIRQEITNELPNILAAWHWIVEMGREELLDQALWSLCEYYRGENRFQECEALFSRAEKQLDQRGRVRASLLHRLGILHNMIGTYDQGAEVLKESLALSKKHGALWDETYALFALTINRGFTNDIDAKESKERWRQCARQFEEAGDPLQEARALNNLATYLEHSDEREKLIRYSISLFKENQGYFGLTLALCHLAFERFYTRGDYEEANRLLEEAITIERQRSNAFRLIIVLNFYSHMLIHQGEYARAKRHFEESLEISQSFDLGRGIIRPEGTLCGLGQLAILQGNYLEAEKVLHEALELNKANGDPYETAPTLNALCKLALAKGQLEKARALCFEAKRHLEQATLNDRIWKDAYLSHLGNLAELNLAQGDMESAKQHLLTALKTAQDSEMLPAQLTLLLGYANLLQKSSEGEEAALLGVVINHKATTFDTRKKAKERFAALSEGAQEKAIERNKTLGLEQVIKEILLAGV